ncbi:hypothetical protein [Pseudoxanthobacter sp.]|uniref:hypothetical protein n=1 Tax=Pseudoxanthobacter sp. TaxID=1925742 RepID=UPI002FE31BAE
MAVGRVAKAVVALCLLAVSGACSTGPMSALGFSRETIAEVPPPPLAEAPKMTFAIAPPTGVPGNLGDALIRKLHVYAAQEGLRFPTEPDMSTNYVLKVHLTAVGSYSGGTVSYIADVYDAQGRRATRLAGSVPAGSTYADPWSSASDGTMSALALQIAFGVRAWLFSGS